MDVDRTGAWLPLRPPPPHTGTELRALMQQAEMTGTELALRLGILPLSISRYLRGARPVPGPVVAYLELVVAARRAGVAFEAGARIGRPRSGMARDAA